MSKDTGVTNFSAGLVAAGKISYALRVAGTATYGSEVNTGITELAGSVGEYIASITDTFFGSVRWTEWEAYESTIANQAVEDFSSTLGIPAQADALQEVADLQSNHDEILDGLNIIVPQIAEEVSSILADGATEATATAAVEAALDAAAAADAVQTNIGTQQKIRDAMKLAATDGASAAGSVDAQLALVKAKTDLITTNVVNVVSPFSSGGTVLTLIAGDDYPADHLRSIKITPKTWLDPTDATIKLHITDLESGSEIFATTGSVVEGEEQYEFEPVHADTAQLTRADLGRYQFAVKYHYPTEPEDPEDPDDEDVLTVLLGSCVVAE